MANFDLALVPTLKEEGGYLERKDTGEVANFGITLKWYKATIDPKATREDIKNLTVMRASGFYKTYFWDVLRCYAYVDQKLANKVFDLGVNCGQGTISRMLQTAVNDLSTRKIKVDGVIGPDSIRAINQCDPKVLLSRLKVLAEARYREIAENDKNHRKDLKGWLERLGR